MKFKLIPIEKIEKINYSGKVYDLEVQKDHSYTVRGIIVHNSVCTTRLRAGVGVPQLSALEVIRDQVKSQTKSIKFISDGGIVTTGDIAKALKFADFVMLGNMLAGTAETPGKAFRGESGEWYKVYGGSASGENKVSNGQDNRFVEGMVKTIPFRGKVKYILREIDDGLRSAMSYSNASNIQEFQEKCEFIHLSNGGKKESKI